MSEQNVNQSPAPDGRKVHPSIATPETAVEYITKALTTGELHMKEACKELGWSFPRVRSRARTIAGKLNSTLTRKERGVYYLEPHASSDPTGTTEATDIVSDTAVDTPQKGDEHSLDLNVVEAALMGSTTNPNE